MGNSHKEPYEEKPRDSNMAFMHGRYGRRTRLQFLLPASLEARISVPCDRSCERNNIRVHRLALSAARVSCGCVHAGVTDPSATIEGLRCGIVDSDWVFGESRN